VWSVGWGGGGRGSVYDGGFPLESGMGACGYFPSCRDVLGYPSKETQRWGFVVRRVVRCSVVCKLEVLCITVQNESYFTI